MDLSDKDIRYGVARVIGFTLIAAVLIAIIFMGTSSARKEIINKSSAVGVTAHDSMPLSPGEVRITSPSNGKTDLPMCVIVTGVANIPAKSALYIFIKPESAGAFYPQSSRAGFGPVGRGFKGNWRERVYLGTKELGIGDNYEIIAVVVDETTATDISRTMTAWSAAKDFPGMAELPGSEKARITVTRAQ